MFVTAFTNAVRFDGVATADEKNLDPVQPPIDTVIGTFYSRRLGEW